ncbi:hypothetical protein [Streptomyces sp. NPDC020681]|uniref:hypothetical protein n=1 Tax=Streptomyces sp. NPDC020681 TaxID=3365083 RepID=UPI0037ACDD60
MRVSPQRPEGEEKSVGWRLVGPNNRELGRSAEAFGSLAECQAAVARLREQVADARVLLSMPEAAASWTWRVELEGQVVAVAGRPYLRQRECQYNLGQFLAAVPVAQLAEGVPHRPRMRGALLRGPAQPRSTRAEPRAGQRADQDEEGHAVRLVGMQVGTGTR